MVLDEIDTCITTCSMKIQALGVKKNKLGDLLSKQWISSAFSFKKLKV